MPLLNELEQLSLAGAYSTKVVLNLMRLTSIPLNDHESTRLCPILELTSQPMCDCLYPGLYWLARHRSFQVWTRARGVNREWRAFYCWLKTRSPCVRITLFHEHARSRSTYCGLIHYYRVIVYVPYQTLPSISFNETNDLCHASITWSKLSNSKNRYKHSMVN